MARNSSIGSSITINANGKSRTWSLSGFEDSLTKDNAKTVAEIVNAMKIPNQIKNYSLGTKQTWTYIAS